MWQRHVEIVQNASKGCCEKRVDVFWPPGEWHWSDSLKNAQPKTDVSKE